jgi:Ca2+:H+ antiporter
MRVDWLLVFVPVAVALEHFAPGKTLLIFIASGLAIVPLAGWLGRATEHVAERTSEGVGGLLNATFGNAAELIIALSALRAGLYGVVKASIVGSIIGNILLVLGAAMLAGGTRHHDQTYNAAGARSQATMLTLAVIALVAPASYRAVTDSAGAPDLSSLSVIVSVVLLAVYALNLVFSLITHPGLFAGDAPSLGKHGEQAAPWSLKKSAAILTASTALIGWMSEVLVGAIGPAADQLGLNDAFVGVFVVAILGNAAEHATAITAAMKNRMDLSLSIAIGSSVQVALFVAPILVLMSHFIAPAPMDLLFPGGLILTVFLSVLITGQIAGDGRSHWLKGAQLLAVYVLLGIAFFFVPGSG